MTLYLDGFLSPATAGATAGAGGAATSCVIPSKRNGGPALECDTKKETLLNANAIKITNTKNTMDDVLPIEVPKILAIIFYINIIFYTKCHRSCLRPSNKIILYDPSTMDPHTTDKTPVYDNSF